MKKMWVMHDTMAPFLFQAKTKLNPNNPASWTNAQLKEWVKVSSSGAVDAEILCPWESGMQVLRIPETDFICRVMAGSDFGEKRAKVFYTKLWKLLIDARTAERKEKLRAKQPKRNVKAEADAWLAEAAKNDKLIMNQQREKEWETHVKQAVNQRRLINEGATK
jgi:hypothetical protein